MRGGWGAELWKFLTDFVAHAADNVEAEQREDLGFLQVEFRALRTPEAGLQDELLRRMADSAGGFCCPTQTALGHFGGGFELRSVVGQIRRDEKAGEIAYKAFVPAFDDLGGIGRGSELDL